MYAIRSYYESGAASFTPRGAGNAAGSSVPRARTVSVGEWAKTYIKQDEIDRYLNVDENGEARDFIDEDAIEANLEAGKGAAASPEKIREIIRKAYDIKLMSSADTAALLQVTDPALKEEIFKAAREIKTKVYDNRVVTFAPLYCGSKCVNKCKYCGFSCDNETVERRVLTVDEIEAEARVLAGKLA